DRVDRRASAAAGLVSGGDSKGAGGEIDGQIVWLVVPTAEVNRVGMVKASSRDSDPVAQKLHVVSGATENEAIEPDSRRGLEREDRVLDGPDVHSADDSRVARAPLVERCGFARGAIGIEIETVTSDQTIVARIDRRAGRAQGTGPSRATVVLQWAEQGIDCNGTDQAQPIVGCFDQVVVGED